MEQFTACPHCGQPMLVPRPSAAIVRPPKEDCQDERPVRVSALRQLRMAKLAAVLDEGREQKQKARFVKIAPSAPPAPTTPHLTSNGLLRWLELVHGVDVEGAKREIMGNATIMEGCKVGASVVKVFRNKRPFRLHITDGRIVTVTEQSRKLKKMRPPKRTGRPGIGLKDELSEYFKEMAEGALP